jgi:hypothetical protein
MERLEALRVSLAVGRSTWGRSTTDIPDFVHSAASPRRR